MSRTIADDAVASRVEMRKRLTNTFNAFIKVHAVKNESYKDVELVTCAEKDFTIELVEHFIAYLQDTTRTAGTARVYLSALFVLLKEKHKALYDRIVTPNSSEWQAKLRRHFSKKCHDSRTVMVTHKMPINAADNHYICKELFRRGMFEESTLQALDWANGGRISEGCGLLWRDLELFEKVSLQTNISCVRVHWYRGKTSLLTATYNFIHATAWEECVYHSLARLIVLARNPNSLIFPVLAGTIVKTRMNSLLKDIYEKWRLRYTQEQQQRNIDEEAGLYVDEFPFVMTEGITTHGSRAGMIQTVRGLGVQDEAVTKHAGTTCAFFINYYFSNVHLGHIIQNRSGLRK